MFRRRSNWHQHPSWLQSLPALAGLILIFIASFGGDPWLKRPGLALLALTPILQITTVLVRVLRSGRASATTRRDHPSAYWSVVFALVLLILFLCAMVGLALLD
jgi:hypothetical protein